MSAHDRRTDEPEGGASWLTTFADLMALILTFFVLLLASANLEKEKYAEIAQSFRDGFSGIGLEYIGRFAFGGATSVVVPIEPESTGRIPVESADAAPAEAGEAAQNGAVAAARAARIVLLDDLNTRLAEVVKDGYAEILSSEDRVTVRFTDDFAFPSGAAAITPAFARTLVRLTPTIASASGTVLVTGHTDSVPVAGTTFKSNWGLSTARAVAVVEHILANTTLPIEQARLIPQGRGESTPIAPNRTAEGRARNRRVEISFLADDVLSSPTLTVPSP